MTLNRETIALAAVIAVVGSTLFFATTEQRRIGDDNNVPTKNRLHFIAAKDGAAGTLQMEAKRDIPAGSKLSFNIDGNVVSEPKEQTAAREAAGVDIWYDRHRSFFDPAYNFPFDDFGCFATVIPAEKVDDVVAGLRVSPFRALYGTTAPDVLVSQHYVGVGLSLYAPPDVMGRSFSHWGIGVGHFWPVGDDGGDRSTAFYLSFSTKIP